MPRFRVFFGIQILFDSQLKIYYTALKFFYSEKAAIWLKIK